jgi:hypothetical protein
MHDLQEVSYFDIPIPPMIAAVEATSAKQGTMPRSDFLPSVHVWDLHLEIANLPIECVVAPCDQISGNRNTPSDVR